MGPTAYRRLPFSLMEWKRAVWVLVWILAVTTQVFFWGSESPFLLTKAVFLHLVGSFACLAMALAGLRQLAGAGPSPATGALEAGLARALLAPALFVGYAATRWPWFAETRPEIGAPFLWGAILLVAWPTAGAITSTPGGLSRLSRLLVVLGGLTGGYALLQACGLDRAFYPSGGRVLSAGFDVGPGGPPYATLGNPNFLGEYLAALLPLAVAGSLGCQGSSRWLASGAATLMAAAIPLTLTRRAWLGAVIGLGLALSLRPRSKGSTRHLLGLSLVLVAASLLATAAAQQRPGAIAPWGRVIGTLRHVSPWEGGQERAEKAASRDVSTAPLAAPPWEGRSLWWSATSRIVGDHPVWGIGAGQFRDEYPAYQGRTLLPRLATGWAAVAPAAVESPHNDYLQVAAELGIPGVLLLLGILGLLLWDGARAARRSDGPERGWRAGSLGGLGALLTAALLGYPLHTASGLYMVSSLAALAVSPTPGEAAPRPSPPRWQWVLLAAVTALGFWQTGALLRVYAASLHLHRGSEALLRRDIPNAFDALERAHEVSPRDSQVRVALGRAYLASGRPDLALEHLQAGLHGFDSAPLRTLLGNAFLQVGQKDAAQEMFRVGVAWFPGYAPLHLSYGRLLAARGDEAEASRELARAVALDPTLADPHYLLGKLRAAGGDAAGAAAALRRFLELARPGDPRGGGAEALLRGLGGVQPDVDNGKKPGK